MTTGHHLNDDTHSGLADALAALDTDPANPHDLRDRIILTLGDVGGLWSASIHPDEIDKRCASPAGKRAAARYRDILRSSETMMTMLRAPSPSA